MHDSQTVPGMGIFAEAQKRGWTSDNSLNVNRP